MEKDAIKRKLRTLIKDSSVTVILIGSQTGGLWWVDWEIYNSLRKSEGNERNGLFGIHIKYKEHWVPDRLTTEHWRIRLKLPMSSVGTHRIYLVHFARKVLHGDKRNSEDRVSTKVVLTG